MATTTPRYESRLIEDKCELHYSCAGFWDKDTMQAFFDQLSETIMPLLKARNPYYSIGDFTDALPQDRETADVIMANLQTAVKFGLQRSAIVNASSLMKMQYRRVAQGVEVEFFDDKTAALEWLRAGR